MPLSAQFSISTAYRPDVDGLRAIAVLGVVLYHAGVPGIPGGFVGVDVFFVISGYLISRILLRELQAGNYSIVRFYVRRARRILPALFVVVVATFLLGWWILLPLEYSRLANQGLGVLFFASNWLFWRESGYFDAAAEFKPLLHTWSLAVEEQFYLFWPLILWLVFYKTGRLRLMFWLIAGISFLISCYLVIRKPSAGFFLIQSRAWELLVGAGLVIHGDLSARVVRFRHVLSIVGLSLILLSYVFLNKASNFPAWNAVWPCLGAALLILVGADAWVNRLLQWSGLVVIGLISYSLYLWHWPLLVFLRIVHFGDLPLQQALSVVGISILLAWLSWRFVEQPFRRDSGQSSTVILVGYGFGLSVLASLALMIKTAEGVPNRMPQAVVDAQLATKDVNQARDKCHLGLEQAERPMSSQCVTGNAEAVKVLVWGDSHAEALTPGLSQTKTMAGLGIRQMTKTSCPPLLGVTVVRSDRPYENCVEFNRSVLQYLTDTPQIETVFLSARWPVYVNASGFGLPESVSQVPKHYLQTLTNNKQGIVEGGDAFALGLRTTIAQLKKLNKKVVIIGSVPEMLVDVPSCLARKRLYGQAQAECALTVSQVQERLSVADRWIADIAKESDVSAYFPRNVLCTEVCSVVDDNDQILYYDHNHLSAKGSAILFNRFFTGSN